MFRLLSTKPQPPGGTIVTAPSGLLSGLVGNPFDRRRTTSGHLWCLRRFSGVPQRDAGIELVRLGDEARLYDQILKNDWILKTDSENL